MKKIARSMVLFALPALVFAASAEAGWSCSGIWDKNDCLRMGCIWNGYTCSGYYETAVSAAQTDAAFYACTIPSEEDQRIEVRIGGDSGQYSPVRQAAYLKDNTGNDGISYMLMRKMENAAGKVTYWFAGDGVDGGKVELKFDPTGLKAAVREDGEPWLKADCYAAPVTEIISDIKAAADKTEKGGHNCPNITDEQNCKWSGCAWDSIWNRCDWGKSAENKIGMYCSDRETKWECERAGCKWNWMHRKCGG